jgi:hypothetical protein
MDSSQTALDYKQYFSEKFISMFKEFIVFLLSTLSSENIKDNTEYSSIQNINKLKDKLDYNKIITKISQNTKLVEALTFLNKNNFNEEISKKILNNDKFWTIMPSFNICKIINIIDNVNDKKEIYEKINGLHICAVTYVKVLEEIDNNKDESFNPFNSVGDVNKNVDIQSLYSGVDVKNISAYEMLMESIINKQMDNKMGDYMNNIQEDDVNEAASKLHDVLNSEKFQENKGTSKILSDMLNNIKNEVINLKNDAGSDNDKMKGKKGVEQLLGIAQKVAGNMMGTIKESNVSVLDIWDATSNLAKNTVQSDALNIVDNLIRNNIEANLKKSQENSNISGNIVELDSHDNKQVEISEKKNKKNKK